jgi:beta-1,4-mannosyltransferase
MAIWLASFLGRYRIIIDFHNYGYTILNLAIKNKAVMAVATWYEHFFARKASAFLCVSDQMKQDLKDKWNIEAITLYDRPVRELRPPTSINKDVFLKKYNQPKI